MAAIEDVTLVHPRLRDDEDDSRQQGQTDGRPRASGFVRAMADPMGQAMLAGLQEYLQDRNPEGAHAIAQAIRGELPGFPGNATRDIGGVREGDIIVALIGGFFPYVLRPRLADGDRGPTALHLTSDGSKYDFIGDCYLHGSMNGEDFITVDANDSQRFWVDPVHLTDISIM
jgi:hypothetical protein